MYSKRQQILVEEGIYSSDRAGSGNDELSYVD
jgi:hypothetical protein